MNSKYNNITLHSSTSCI